jgi:hypothetical protein
MYEINVWCMVAYNICIRCDLLNMFFSLIRPFARFWAMLLGHLSIRLIFIRQQTLLRIDHVDANIQFDFVHLGYKLKKKVKPVYKGHSREPENEFVII